MELRAYLVLRELMNFSLLPKTPDRKLPGTQAVHWTKDSTSGPVVVSSQGLLGVQASAFLSFPKCSGHWV